MMTYTVVALRERDGRYTVLCPALSDAGSCGDSLGEALVAAREALSLYVETLRERGWPIPPDTPCVSVDLSEAAEAGVYRLPVGEVAPVG
jgi:predicted RNase H-like HicB family nuclease